MDDDMPVGIRLVLADPMDSPCDLVFSPSPFNTITSGPRWQTCPVCGGQGHLNKPPHVAGDQHTWSTSHTGTYQCGACNGTRMVVMPEPA